MVGNISPPLTEPQFPTGNRFSSGVVEIFLLWERWHGIMVTYTIITVGGGGGGAWMNGHFSRVKIYVQTGGGCNFLANEVVF